MEYSKQNYNSIIELEKGNLFRLLKIIYTSMKTFLVITKVKREELREKVDSPNRYKRDINGDKYFYVNLYLETWKCIIETPNKNNIYEHYKNTDHRIVNVQEIEPFKKKERKKKDTGGGTKFSLGEMFKDQLAEFNEKNADDPYLNSKSKKKLKTKFLKEVKRYVKK